MTPTAPHPLRRGAGCVGALAALCSCAVPCAAQGQATFTPMGMVPAPWSILERVTTVTDDGRAIGTIDYSSTGPDAAFVWSAGTGFVVLPPAAPNASTVAGHASPDGRFIPGSSQLGSGVMVAVLWIDGGGPYTLPGAPSNVSAKAWGVSWDGTVVGGELFTPGLLAEGWLWSPERGFEALGVPSGATYTAVVQLPQHGDVVLSAIIWGSLGGAQEGARWTRDKGWEPLGDLPGGDFFSNLGRCSRDGRVGAGRASPPEGPRAARWTEASGWMQVALTPWTNSISGDGWVVLAAGGAIWNPVDGQRYLNDVLEKEFGLNLNGWKLDGHAISDNGRFIAGVGVNPQNEPEGFLVEMPPFCYADCDRSTGKGVLDVFDFLCFMNRFNAKDPYGNCDNDGAFDVYDFLCFINHFNEGCP